MHDVIVVGGGPGGLSAATALAREGFDVLVAEEHRVTGEPVHCTGVLAKEAFDEFDIPRESILNALQTVRFFSPSGQTISHATETIEALVVDRALFDRGLHQRAREAGASVVLDARVAAVDVQPRSVIVRCEDGRELRGRAVVIACGASYKLQRSLGLGLPAAFLRSAQMELPATEAGDVEVHFGHDIAPKGFAWVVPAKRGAERYVRVGLMCDHSASTFFARLVDRARSRWGLQSPASMSDIARPRQKILPLAPIRRTYADRVVAVGDAAGLVKATTGGGIYYSLVSGTAAAAVLAESLRADDLSAGSLKRYEKQWRGRLGAELRAQLALRMLAQRLGDSDIDALFELARTNGIMPIVRQTARFNEHRELIVSLFKHPPSRRLLFKQLVARTAAFSTPQ